MYVVLVYDISLNDNGARVLSRVFKTCKKYLVHVQNSVFEGEISEAQLLKLEYEIGEDIRKEQDSVIIFKSRHERWLQKDFLGLQGDFDTNFV